MFQRLLWFLNGVAQFFGAALVKGVFIVFEVIMIMFNCLDRLFCLGKVVLVARIDSNVRCVVGFWYFVGHDGVQICNGRVELSIRLGSQSVLLVGYYNPVYRSSSMLLTRHHTRQTAKWQMKKHRCFYEIELMQ